jgi:ribosome-associated protein
MIGITPLIQIDEHEIEFVFIRSAGPGGQNVNKVSSAVQLRLIQQAGRRLTAEGILIIEARRFRSQERNRQAAEARLIRLIQKAVEPPKPRHKTKPTHASIVRRLESKRKRGEIKQMRRDSGIVE